MAYFVHSETKVVSPAEAAEGETVTMIFPKRVLLTLQDGRKIDFPAGTHEVPVELQNHIYLELNGVKLYSGKPAGREDHPNGLVTPELAEFFKACGKDNSEEYQGLLDSVPKEADFQKSFEDWKAHKAEAATKAAAVNPEHDIPAKEELKEKSSDASGKGKQSGRDQAQH